MRLTRLLLGKRMAISGASKHMCEIENARLRVANYAIKTPLQYSPKLSEETGAQVYLKLESEQVTNSFKLRGACNKISLLLKERESQLKEHGLVTASNGNHGRACAHMCSVLSLPISIYTSTEIATVKEQALLEFPNVNLVKYCKHHVEAEIHARSLDTDDGIKFVSPYNDIDVVYGQATIGCEILEQLPDVDIVFVPVGGGGLIAGIGMYCKLKKPSIQIIGCQPGNDAAMMASIYAGAITPGDGKPTLADGVAGEVEPDTLTFPLCQQFVDDWVALTEEEIELGLVDIYKYDNKVVEGVAALTVAALRKMRASVKDKKVALIICGSNISMAKVGSLLRKYS